MANITTPMAYITVNKGRTKIKENKVVYMDNGTEFEIELFNPTQNTVLAKISINNKQISYSGLVLRPGERVFLERYIDDASKFKFETYNVSGNSEEVKKAIEKNGLIKVEFYNEDTTPAYTNLSWTVNNPSIFTYTTNTAIPTYCGTVSTTTSGGIGFASSYNCSNLNLSNTLNDEPTIKLKSLRSITETGRVEKGSHSDQTFQTVNKKFYSYTTNVVEYHIKPMSQKFVDIKDVNKMNKYCTKCGRKSKQTDNFCAGCGNRF